MSEASRLGLLSLLPTHLRARIRSGASVSSVAHCTEELVFNAIDAGATCVAVRVDLTLYKVQVVDNGSGMSKRSLEKVGSRYMTSKCTSLKDLQRGGTAKYGYRGEALASIRQLSAVLQILSRQEKDEKTLCTLFAKGKRRRVEEHFEHRQSKGTTVTVMDFLYNLPVRKRMLNASLDLEDIRRAVASIALVNPSVSFTVKNEAKDGGQVILATGKASNSMRKVFSALFPGFHSGERSLLTLRRSVQSGNPQSSSPSYTLSGVVAEEGHTSKDRQFFYVNHRPVLNSPRVGKLLNAIFRKTVMTVPPPMAFSGSSKTDQVWGSPNKQPRLYAVFCLDLELPFEEYDVTVESRKFEVEFLRWDTVRSFLEETLQQFLLEHNLFIPSERFRLESVLKDAAIGEPSTEKSGNVRGGLAGDQEPEDKDGNEPVRTTNSSSLSLSLSPKLDVVKKRQKHPLEFLPEVTGIQPLDITVARCQPGQGQRPVTSKGRLSRAAAGPVVKVEDSRRSRPVTRAAKQPVLLASTPKRSSASKSSTSNGRPRSSSLTYDINDKGVFKKLNFKALNQVASQHGQVGKSDSSRAAKQDGGLYDLNKLRQKFSVYSAATARSTSSVVDLPSNQSQQAGPSRFVASETSPDSFRFNPVLQLSDEQRCMDGDLSDLESFAAVDPPCRLDCSSGLFFESAAGSAHQILEGPKKSRATNSSTRSSLSRCWASQSPQVTRINVDATNSAEDHCSYHTGGAPVESGHLMVLGSENALSVHGEEDLEGHSSEEDMEEKCLAQWAKRQRHEVQLDTTLMIKQIIATDENRQRSPPPRETTTTFVSPCGYHWQDSSEASGSSWNIGSPVGSALELGMVSPPTTSTTSTGFQVNHNEKEHSSGEEELEKPAGYPWKMSKILSYEEENDDADSAEDKEVVAGSSLFRGIPGRAQMMSQRSSTSSSIAFHEEFLNRCFEKIPGDCCETATSKFDEKIHSEGSIETQLCSTIFQPRRGPPVMSSGPTTTSNSSSLGSNNGYRESAAPSLGTPNTSQKSLRDSGSDPKRSQDHHHHHQNKSARKSEDDDEGCCSLFPSASFGLLEAGASLDVPVSAPELTAGLLSAGVSRATSPRKRYRSSGPTLLPVGKSPFLNKGEKICIGRQPGASLVALDPAHLEASKGQEASKWANPAFRFEKEPLDLHHQVEGAHSLNRFSSGILNLAIRFDSFMFRQTRVLGQVDRKFVAVVLQNVRAARKGHLSGRRAESAGNSTTDVLVLFDQHAAHERIRLERLLEEHFPDRKAVDSVPIEDTFTLELSPEEARLLPEFGWLLQKFGLVHELVEDEVGSSGEGAADPTTPRILVSGVPRCFRMREENELKYHRTSPLMQLTRDLVREVFLRVRETRGGGMAVLPAAVEDVLKSRACRGAIKFGHGLRQERCVWLLKTLMTCKAPFQCAHGRPSLAPLVDLRQLRPILPKLRPSSSLKGGSRKKPRRPSLNFASLRQRVAELRTTTRPQ